MAKAAKRKKTRKMRNRPRIAEFRHEKCGGITLAERGKEALIEGKRYCQWCRSWFNPGKFKRVERSD